MSETPGHPGPNGEWRVIHSGGHWWNWPYHVIDPDGSPIAITWTIRGAKRAIKKERKRVARWAEADKWRNGPTLYREKA